MSLQHFSAKEVKRIAARDEYADGTYVFKVTGAKKISGDTAPEGIQLSVAALTNPDDVESTHRMSYIIRLPLGATEESGPVASFQLRQSGETATVLFDDLEGVPTWNRETKQNEIFGAPVDKREVEVLTATNLEAALNKLVDIYEAGEEGFAEAFVGKCFGMTLAHSKPNEDGRRYLNSRGMYRAEALPEGLQLQDPANFVYGGGDDDKVEETPVAKAPVAKKAVPAKSAKRR